MGFKVSSKQTTLIPGSPWSAGACPMNEHPSQLPEALGFSVEQGGRKEREEVFWSPPALPPLSHGLWAVL